MNIIRFYVEGNDGSKTIDLRDYGYRCGAKKILCVGNNGYCVNFGESSGVRKDTIFASSVTAGGNHIEFPIINGKSPCTFTFRTYSGSTSGTNINLFVEELGGVADPNYFET